MDSMPMPFEDAVESEARVLHSRISPCRRNGRMRMVWWSEAQRGACSVRWMLQGPNRMVKLCQGVAAMQRAPLFCNPLKLEFTQTSSPHRSTPPPLPQLQHH